MRRSMAVLFACAVPVWLLLLVFSPPALPAGLGGVPNIVIELTEDGEARAWSDADSTGRAVIVQFGRSISYNASGWRRVGLTFHPSDPLSSQSGGGLTEAEQRAASALAARLVMGNHAIHRLYRLAADSPDGAYEEVDTFARIWWIATWIAGLLVAIGLPWAARFAQRVPVLLRRGRARRGLCPHCRYDTTGSAPGECPECGSRWDMAELEHRVLI